MTHQSQWCTVDGELLRFGGETIRVADVSSTSISRRTVPERVYKAGTENLALWIPSFVLGWSGVLFTNWELGAKALLGFFAFFGTGGLATIPIDKFKIKRWNAGRPSYDVLTVHFRGSRQATDLDLYAAMEKKAKYQDEEATATAIDAEIQRVRAALEASMRGAA